MENKETIDSWYYEDNGKRVGPVNTKDIIIMIQINKLKYGSIIWKQDLKDWIKIEDSEFFKYLNEVPPPLSGNYINDSIVWILAFAPLIGMFLEYLIAYNMYEEDLEIDLAMADTEFWYVTLLLNILLAIWDEKKLKNAGIKISGLWAAFIVPFYLFKRSKVLGHNYSYLIVWIISFFITLAIEW